MSNLHFSLGFRRLHNNTAIMAAMMSKTIDAMTMVIMMTILDPPIVFNRPTPEKQRMRIRLQLCAMVDYIFHIILPLHK